MKLTIFGLTIIAAGLLTLGVKSGQLDWVATPNGKDALVWLLFAVLVTVLACLGMRTHRRDRADREAQEWAELDAWEEAMHAAHNERAEEWLETVRSITQAELDAEDARLTTTHVPVPAPAPVAVEWPTRQTPLLLDLAPTYLPDRPLTRWDPARRYDESYTGNAATFASDMRDGVHVYPVEDHAAKVFAGLYTKKDYVDAMPDSPAPQGRPRHRHGTARGTDTQRRDPDFVSWEQADWEQPTGQWPVVAPRELVGVSA
jgi:hypothetical protein